MCSEVFILYYSTDWKRFKICVRITKKRLRPPFNRLLVKLSMRELIRTETELKAMANPASSGWTPNQDLTKDSCCNRNTNEVIDRSPEKD